jgi:hypothetical protein
MQNSTRNVLAVLAVKILAVIAVVFLSVQPVFASDTKSQVSFTTEAGDASKNEVERIRGVYAPTGQTVVLTIVYKTGIQVKYTYAYVSGRVVENRVQTEEVFKPRPGDTGKYLQSETRYDVKSGKPLWQKLYRPDGSTERWDRFSSAKIDRIEFGPDGFTKLNVLSLPLNSGGKEEL